MISGIEAQQGSTSFFLRRLAIYLAGIAQRFVRRTPISGSCLSAIPLSGIPNQVSIARDYSEDGRSPRRLFRDRMIQN
jgi:hypothetical protein